MRQGSAVVVVADFVGIIRDKAGNGVRDDRVDGWARNATGDVRVHLSGSGYVDLIDVTRREFVERLDRALTAMWEADV